MISLLMRKQFYPLIFGNNLVEMIKYINDSEFFSKIISELEINQNKNIIIHPQFSKQKIIFGYPDNLEEKFEKINIFYKKIIQLRVEYL